METVSVSAKYQIVIPKAVRDAVGLRPGQKVQILHYQNRIELIPVLSMQQARGFLKGIDTTVEREGDRL